MGSDRRYLSRKFWLAAAVYATSVPMVCMGLLTPDQWISLVTWVLGLYLGANVADQAATK